MFAVAVQYYGALKFGMGVTTDCICFRPWVTGVAACNLAGATNSIAASIMADRRLIGCCG